ncbi:MAG TPA: hemerythrin domain-containing protein [Ilumatobacteraceae bacterium]|nr:hemerythrin domain-containing protein [Ilumatobacteraceae bacterium]
MTATLTTAPLDPFGYEVPEPSPDLTNYRQAHRAMRIADDQLVEALTEIVAGDRNRAAALHHWFNGYGGELRTHHRIEDDLIFPALAARTREYAGYSDGLADDHHQLDQLIDTIAAALAHMASGSREWAPAHSVALSAAVELRDLLLEHLDLEDADVLPMIERNISVEDFEAIEKQLTKFMSLRQALFTVPWWMAVTEPEVAAKSYDEAPLLLKVIYALTRRSFARRTALAFGTR